MTPPARTQAAIELLDAVVAAARDNGPAADTLIARYFAQRRYAGSKDRRAVRELVYAAIRACGERPASGRAAALLLADQAEGVRATFDGSAHGPAPIDPAEPRAVAGVAPVWLTGGLASAGLDAAEQAALIGRAPLDIRVNRLRATIDQIGAQVEVATRIPGLPDALRLPTGFDIAPLAGLAEPQDAGSQAVTLAVGAAPGQRVVDLCAGAGGKTLALAAAMANQGELLACDTDRGRLQRLPPRAAAAGVTIATTRLLDPGKEAAMLADWGGTADAVLVDAPCSGTGTWRRNPEARWRLTPDRLARLVAAQARLLDLGAALVRPGGALVFVTCSLLDEEGPDQVAALLSRAPGWTPAPLEALPFGRRRGPGWRLTLPATAPTAFSSRACSPRDNALAVLGLELPMRVLPFALSAVLAATSLTTSLHGQRPAAPVDARSLQLLAQGRAERAAGNLDAATDTLETALAVDPRNRAAFLTLAEVEQARGLPGKAIRLYREALALDPDDTAALRGQGEALVTKGALARAQANLIRIRTLCKAAACPDATMLAASIAKGPPVTTAQATTVPKPAAN